MEYKEEKIICQNCKQDFTIEPDDFGYYEKMGVLIPKICSHCRAQLRLSFRNERFLYKRICDHCKKNTISMFSANKTYPVWCHECWRSDDLDGKKYAMDYDPAKPFFEQFNELWQKVPKPSLVHMNSINSEYLNHTADTKNCYMIFESSNNEDCI